jgi:glutathione S-transferase
VTATATTTSTPTLYHIEVSHYNEKARWALDYKNVPHVRRAPPPMMHMAWAYAMTRSRTFPVLKLNGEAIGDSTRIIQALERHYPEPSLYPDDPERRRRALDLEDFFDEELGPQIRAYIFSEVARDADSFAALGAPSGGPLRTVFRAAAPVGTLMLKRRYGIDAQAAKLGREKTVAALDRLEAEIGASGYLAGDAFTVADLTAAALFMPIVRPPEMQYARDERLPAPLEEFRQELAVRPGFEWVREIYRRHRGESAEIRR